MYVTEEMITAAAARYGEPARATFTIPIEPSEYRRIRASQKYGRQHDFTLYIIKDSRVVVTAKHSYPPGLYRAPSGGLHPGEHLYAGIRREAMEETGCEIELESFLLRTNTTFKSEIGLIRWSSYVFQAAFVRGEFNFTDHKEIREVGLATLEDFHTFSAIMRKSSIGGLHYRAALHEAVEKLLCF